MIILLFKCVTEFENDTMTKEYHKSHSIDISKLSIRITYIPNVITVGNRV